MKTTIRANSFETNSSSAHALCMFSPEQWHDFVDGGMYLRFDALSDIELWEYEPEDGDIEKMPPFAVSYASHPVHNTYVLVPADQAEEFLKSEEAESDYPWRYDMFIAPSYEGEQPYWWSHESAGLMTYEDMTKSTWHDEAWPKVEIMPDGWVKMYHSRER